MRFAASIIFAVVLGIFFGYVSGMAENNALYIYCAFPIALSVLASFLLIVVARRLGIEKHRQFLMLALVCGGVMLIGNQFFTWKVFVDKVHQNVLSNLPAAQAYAQIDQVFERATGYTGYIGFMIWKATHTLQSVTVYTALPVSSTPQVASFWDALFPQVLEALIFLIVPAVILYVYNRQRIEKEAHDEVTFESNPLAYFRNPAHEMAMELFRTKNWSALIETMFAGSAPNLPALEIHQSRNTDPLTGNYYLYLMERTADNLLITQKTLPVTHGDLQNFLSKIQPA